MDRVEILNRNEGLEAILGNAKNVSYTRPLKDAGRATFALPYNDPKNKLCEPYGVFVRIVENEKWKGLYIPERDTLDKTGTGLVTYEAIHAITTLAHKIMPGYHQVGGRGFPTREVLEYILSFQIVKRWQLGRCAFSREFEYAWNSANLYAALFSVPPQFTQDYIWRYDFTTRPWTIHLDATKRDGEPECYVRRGKNQRGIVRTVDKSGLCTRLYCYGYGEGDNQLTIADANGGVIYLESPPEIIAEYGILEGVFIDRRFEIAENLKERGGVILAELQEPRVEYSIEAVDLYPGTQNPIDEIDTGKRARIIDEDIELDEKTYVIEITKPDVLGHKSAINTTLANKPSSLADTITSIAERLHYEQLSPQGATCAYAYTFSGSIDPTHPARLKVFLPDNLVHINRLMMTFSLGPFRAYSKSIATGGGGGSTSSAGGGGRKTSEASSISSSGQSITLPAGTVSIAYTGLPYTEQSSDGWRDHWHQTIFGSGNQSLPPHSHGIAHTHDTDIPDHDHNFTIPQHAHGIEYGIYEGPRANNVAVYVRGERVPIPDGVTEFDIAPYMADPETRTISRGTHHEIRIEPDNLSYIDVTITAQVFVQSRGGNLY